MEVALFKQGECLWRATREAKFAANGACLALLQEGLAILGANLTDIEAYCADLGPGSFTGTRVGVVLAKTLAFANNAKVCGATAFEFINSTQTVTIPNKKNECFVREPGQEPRLQEAPPRDALGYGPLVISPRYPAPSRHPALVCSLPLMEPHLLTPAYLVEPSISKPKVEYKHV